MPATAYAPDYPKAGYSGREWVENAQKYWVQRKGKRGKPLPGAAPISDFGRRVADILGDCFAGIYHLDQGALSRVEWSNEHYIEFVYYGELATWDFNYLTRLVLLAHQRHVRIGVEGCGPKLMRFIFHPRLPAGQGGTFDSHPTIEKQIEYFNRDMAQEKGSNAHPTIAPEKQDGDQS